MVDFSILKDGKMIEVQKFGDAIQSIQIRHEFDQNTIKRLTAENDELKKGAWKDTQLLKMKQELEEGLADAKRGFPITEEEMEKINIWKKEHEEKVHNLHTLEDRLHTSGAIGGRYEYKFVPTSIGTSGVIRCSVCGEEFEFCEIK